MMHDIVSLLRALAALTVVAGIGVGGWAGYNVYTSRNELEQERVRLASELAGKEKTIDDLRATLETKDQELQALDLAVRLLKIDHRLAEIVVLDQWETDDDGLMTKFQFVEVDKEGKPLEAAKEYTVQGDTVYIDSWVIKFADHHVESGESLRSSSICLFRRVFGANQNPNEGFDLDPVGARPAAYGRDTPPSDFEQKLWENFWEYANDPDKAAAAGIRAAHGEAPSIRLRKSKVYTVTLRASGGLTVSVKNLPRQGEDTLL